MSALIHSCAKALESTEPNGSKGIVCAMNLIKHVRTGDYMSEFYEDEHGITLTWAIRGFDICVERFLRRLGVVLDVD